MVARRGSRFTELFVVTDGSSNVTTWMVAVLARVSSFKLIGICDVPVYVHI